MPESHGYTFCQADLVTMHGEIPATPTFSPFLGLLFVPDKRPGHWLAVRVSPLRRDRLDFPILGDCVSTCSNHLSVFLESRFIGVGADSLDGDGIGPVRCSRS